MVYNLLDVFEHHFVQVPSGIKMGEGFQSPIRLYVFAWIFLSRWATCQWVVETNSVRVKEPAKIAGEFDAAIGDVRFPLHHVQFLACFLPTISFCLTGCIFGGCSLVYLCMGHLWKENLYIQLEIPKAAAPSPKNLPPKRACL
jgi:hypothetical protein